MSLNGSDASNKHLYEYAMERHTLATNVGGCFSDTRAGEGFTKGGVFSNEGCGYGR